MAAPTAVPIMADSDIGVSLTLSSPNSWAKPSVTLNAPPQYLPLGLVNYYLFLGLAYLFYPLL